MGLIHVQLGAHCVGFLPDSSRQRIHIIGLVKGGNRLNRTVEQSDNVHKGISEKTGDAQGHVYPWPIE